MRHLKLIWLAVLAAFASTALLAVAASGASAAEPEWGHCVPAKKGFYEDSNCTKRDEKKGKPKGKYEWNSGAAVACYEKKGGLYKNNTCTEEDVKKGVPKGKYEKTGGPKFTGKGGAGILDIHTANCPKTCVTESGKLTTEEEEGAYNGETLRREQKEGELGGTIDVECTSENATGEAASSNAVQNVQVTFKGCKEDLGHSECSNTANPEEIVTNTLKGELGYISKSKHEVGVVLQPAKADGLFAQFSCAAGLSTEVGIPQSSKQGPAWYEPTNGGDAIISPITPIDKMTNAFTQVYTANEFAENVPNKFEGGPLNVLEAALHNTANPSSRGYWSPGGEEITNVNTPEGEAEIKG